MTVQDLLIAAHIDWISVKRLAGNEYSVTITDDTYDAAERLAKLGAENIATGLHTVSFYYNPEPTKD